MRFEYSSQLREDVNSQVQAALHAKGIVNISLVAEEVRLRNLAENIALEDIEYLVMHSAQLYGAPIEFDGDMTSCDGSGIAATSPDRRMTH